MFDEVIVTVDGSYESAAALGPASVVGRHLGLRVRVIAYYEPPSSEARFQRAVEKQVDRQLFADVEVQVSEAADAVADQLLRCLSASPKALLVMSTRGHGRSAAVLGSVATEVVAVAPGPFLLVGPAYKSSRFKADGPLVVPAAPDDSQDAGSSEGSDWLRSFDYDPIVVTVKKPGTSDASSAHADRWVSGLGSSRRVTLEVLHSLRIGNAIARYANEHRAALIAMTTSAPTGFARIAFGSVTADVLSHAECPVLVSVARTSNRPPAT